jgi:hypothetical protein
LADSCECGDEPSGSGATELDGRSFASHLQYVIAVDVVHLRYKTTVFAFWGIRKCKIGKDVNYKHVLKMVIRERILLLLRQ